MEHVQLLWTGGWDSTFRLLQLALVEGRPVQPHYVIDLDRLSTPYELRAMDAIRERALQRAAQPDLIAPTQIVVRSQFPVPQELARMWQSLDGRMHIGPQYLWLAAVAAGMGWFGVELGMERQVPTHTPLSSLMAATARGEADDPDSALFRYWRFPLIEWSKDDMAAFAREHGFLDLMALIWSCHAPIAGRPCGRCRPCRLSRSTSYRPISPAISAPVNAYRKLRRDGWRSMLERVRTL
jgi:7-cyano-7-deazaguanine synthase